MRYEIIGRLVDKYGFKVCRSLPTDGILVRHHLGYEIPVSNQVLDTATSAEEVAGFILGAFNETIFHNVRKVSD